MFSGKRFALVAALALSLIIPMQSPAAADYTRDDNNFLGLFDPGQEMFWLTEPVKNSEFAYEPSSRNIPGQPPTPGQKPWVYSFGGGSSTYDLPVSRIGYTKPSGGTNKYCEGWNDSKCRKAGNKFYAELFLPPCVEDASSSCIDSIDFNLSGNSANGSLIRTLDTRPVCIDVVCEPTIQTTKFPSNPSKNIPPGSAPSLWSVDGIVNATGTSTYMVSASISIIGTWDKNLNLSDISFTDFTTRVIPYFEREGINYTPAECYPYGGCTWGGDAVTPYFSPFALEKSGCAWKEAGKCGTAIAFTPGTRVELGFRVPKELDGWLQGRLSDANVEIVPINAKLNKLTISGGAIEIPVSGTAFNPKKVKGWEDWAGPEEWDLKSFKVFDWTPKGGGGVEALKMFEKDLGDRSIGRVSIWSAELMRSWYGCENKKTPRLEGLLTTNAMVYNGGLPEYKKGALSYQVGGLHYNHDGSVFKGSYDFIMRSDTARCIYGFTKAPVQVAVSVTEVNGVQSAATTSVFESDGWLRIRAKDFTFSTPTIKAKITQKLNTSVTNKKISQKALADIAKVSIGKKDKVTISVSGGNKGFAKVSSGNVSFKKNGTYQVKIKVKHYKGSTETATITVKVK